MGASILIIGRPGRLRDSLSAILASFPAVDTIRSGDDFVSGCHMAAQQPPSAVIVDGGDYLQEDCHTLKELVGDNGGCRCVIIVSTLQQMAQAKAFGADAVLFQGFSTDILLQALIALDVLPQASAADEATRLANSSSPGVQRARRM